MAVDMPGQIAHRILEWYRANARDLPWRSPPGHPLPLHDPAWPYRVWLSEVMLQQTTVATVFPYFRRFTALWPDVVALAGADDADVMAQWAGLGYYARARNLLACARLVASAHDGRFPADQDALRSLPGIGRYTAAAIAAFAFGQRSVVIDGNIERVTARVFAEPDKAALPALVDAMTPPRSADFAQGMMDLASSVCLPRAPRCPLCPLSGDCLGRESPEAFPARAQKAARPERTGHAWWIESARKVLLVRRPGSGLLGGMRALPSCDWQGQPAGFRPFDADWAMLGTVRHIFTHFTLSLELYAASPPRTRAGLPDGEWWPIDRLDEAGLPSLFRKAASLGLNRETE
jgi:A/G-specific adenine glycosylase